VLRKRCHGRYDQGRSATLVCGCTLKLPNLVRAAIRSRRSGARKRQSLIELAAARKSVEGQQTKMELVY
jgi:hypothetical protein